MSLIDKIQTKLQEADLPGSVCVDLGDAQIGVNADGTLLEDVSTAECTLTLDMATLEAIISGEIDAMNAYFAGDLKVSGDMSIAMALSNVLKE